MKQYIPSMLTLSNLFLGCFAVVCSFTGKLSWAPYLVFAAGWFDMFDGLAARRLGTSSELGKQLDSLADMVTFGLVPGVVLFQMLLKSFEYQPVQFSDNMVLFAMPAFIVTLFSALRLAKFNIDTRQTSGFLGLSTPACTMFFLGLIAAHNGTAGFLNDLFLNTIFLYACIPVFSFLLVSEIPMFAAKVKSLRWKGNEFIYTFGFSCIALLCVFGVLGLALGAIAYITTSLIINKMEKQQA